jgi:hypothetical protein
MSNRIRTEPITTSDEDSSLSSVQDGRGTAFAYRCHMEGLQGYALRVVRPGSNENLAPPLSVHVLALQVGVAP